MKKNYLTPSILCKCFGVTFLIFCVISWHLLVKYYESFLRDLKAGNIKAWGTRLLFAVECVAFFKQQLSTNENRDKISFWEKISKIGESESRRRTRRQIMRALTKGERGDIWGKSNLLFYIGSIVQTVLGNLKGQNVIVMYHPRKPLMTKVDIYQVRDKHKDHQTKLSSSSHLILSHISVRRLLLPSTIVAWSSRLSWRGLLWPGEHFPTFRIQKIFSNI